MITTNEKLVLSIVPADNLTAYNCALEVARRKDEEYKMQPISELSLLQAGKCEHQNDENTELYAKAKKLYNEKK